jgi:hypothetical protein
VQDIVLFITDRRLIVRAEIFMGLFDSDFVAWFPGNAPADSGDVIESVRVIEVPLLGPGLEIVTETERPHLLRGRTLRLQLLFPGAGRARSFLPAG